MLKTLDLGRKIVGLCGWDEYVNVWFVAHDYLGRKCLRNLSGVRECLGKTEMFILRRSLPPPRPGELIRVSCARKYERT